MKTPLFAFHCPDRYKEELKKRTDNMTKYILEALEEKFIRDDRKKL